MSHREIDDIVLFGSVARASGLGASVVDLHKCNDVDILKIGGKPYESVSMKSYGRVNIHHTSRDYLLERALKHDLFVLHLIKEGIWLTCKKFKTALSTSFHVPHWPELSMITCAEQITLLMLKIKSLINEDDKRGQYNKFIPSCLYHLLYRFAQYRFFQVHGEIRFDKESLRASLRDGVLIKKYEIGECANIFNIAKDQIEEVMTESDTYFKRYFDKRPHSKNPLNSGWLKAYRNYAPDINDEDFMRKIGFCYTICPGLSEPTKL